MENEIYISLVHGCDEFTVTTNEGKETIPAPPKENWVYKPPTPICNCGPAPDVHEDTCPMSKKPWNPLPYPPGA